MKKIEKIKKDFLEAQDKMDTTLLKNSTDSMIAYIKKDNNQNMVGLNMSSLTLEDAILLRDWLNEMLKDTR